MHRYTITFIGTPKYLPNMNWFTSKVQHCLGAGVTRVGNSVYAEFLTKESVEESVTAIAELIGQDIEDFSVVES